MVQADSCGVSRAPQYSGIPEREFSLFRLKDYHLLWYTFPGISTINWICNSLKIKSYSGILQPPSDVTSEKFGLFPLRSPLLRELLPPACASGQVCFLLLQVLRCFSSLGMSSPPTLRRRDIPIYIGIGCPIRKSSDQSLLPTPRSLSQVATSFIVSLCQGIHLVPLII